MKKKTTIVIKIAVFLFITAHLNACSGIAEGITRALIDEGTSEDERPCFIEGTKVEGLDSSLESQKREESNSASNHELKVLMVHGIGNHIPGYSGRFSEHLMRALGLNNRDEIIKEVTLRDPEVSDKPIGKLRLSRYTNVERSKKLVFYELTWSEVIRDEKKIIQYDDSTKYTFKRSNLNAYIKQFVNANVPDALIFLGEPKRKILAAVRQSFCWMTNSGWDGYKKSEDSMCDLRSGDRLQQIKEDDYVFVSHSLGSRIIIETLQYYGGAFPKTPDKALRAAGEAIQNKNIKLYMLANQLPLMELGQKRAPVRNQESSYCRPTSIYWSQRFVAHLQIVAFSDPNDILSYPIPPEFAQQYLDSRLCAGITNVSVNVAHPISLFGVADFASPVAAHGDYDKDERVIQIIARGIGSSNSADIVTKRCTWLQTISEAESKEATKRNP